MTARPWLLSPCNRVAVFASLLKRHSRWRAAGANNHTGDCLWIIVVLLRSAVERRNLHTPPGAAIGRRRTDETGKAVPTASGVNPRSFLGGLQCREIPAG